MAYDEELAERIREVVEGEPGLTEKAMFGGLAFLVGGHMAVSASGQGGMLLRCDPAQTDDLVTHPHVQRFEMRGREMDGWLRVDPAAVETEDDLRDWVGRGVAYARLLPAKSDAADTQLSGRPSGPVACPPGSRPAVTGWPRPAGPPGTPPRGRVAGCRRPG